MKAAFIPIEFSVFSPTASKLINKPDFYFEKNIVSVPGNSFHTLPFIKQNFPSISFISK
jgi:hypothetical protein